MNSNYETNNELKVPKKDNSFRFNKENFKNNKQKGKNKTRKFFHVLNIKGFNHSRNAI
jgi:hypothetical protein